MEQEVALHFRDQLRAARALALRDAEAFQGIVVVIEQLGAYCSGGLRDLGWYEKEIRSLAGRSPMATEVPCKLPDFHTLFEMTYEIVRFARNAALHEGSMARHLTTNAVQLSLVLEEALMQGHYRVGDFMVRNPVCAYLWQPLSFVRQTMLVNSFSYLPVPVVENGQTIWQLVSDFLVAQHLRASGEATKDRLIQKLQDLVTSGQLKLLTAKKCYPEDKIETVLGESDGAPVVVLSPSSGELVGILTPYDLL